MSDPTRVSHSRYNLARKCGMQYEFRYLQGIIAPPRAVMVAGSAVDSATDQNLTRKMDTGETMPAEEVADLAADSLETRWQYEEIALDEEEEERGAAQVKADMKDAAVNLSVLHAGSLAQKIEPTAIQRHFEVDLQPAGYSAVLEGYIDIEEQDGRVIRDLKTKPKGGSVSADAASQSVQLEFYALARAARTGEVPEELWLDYLVAYKRGPEVRLSGAKVDEELPQRALNRIESFVRGIELGYFPPARPEDWWCSEKWCGWWNLCPYSRRPTTISIKGEK